MSNTPELVLVGGGNMGSALVGGLVASGMDPRTITVVEIDAAKRSDLAARFGVVTSAGIVAGRGAVVAVKPADAPAAAASLATAGTPREIIARLNSELVKAAVASDLKERLAVLGAEPAVTSPERFGALLKSETEKYGKIVRALGLKAD